MAKRVIHLKLSVRGALMNWTPRDYAGVFTRDDGTPITDWREAKSALMDELSKGHEVLPCSADCDGFDYSGAGCPGHTVEES